MWLFDWEDAAPAPIDADRAYFHATSSALSGSMMPVDLAEGAVEHWERIVKARSVTNRGDRELARGLEEALAHGRSSGHGGQSSD